MLLLVFVLPLSLFFATMDRLLLGLPSVSDYFLNSADFSKSGWMGL